MKRVDPAPLRCPCSGACFKRVFAYDAPPTGEIRFQFSAKGDYRREILQCVICEHFVSIHEMDAAALYEGDYVSSNYADERGLAGNFDRINSLPPKKSDNVQRVRRILAFAGEHFPVVAAGSPPRSILDVGSGLGVFLHRMKAAGWDCTALDPDPRAARHAEQRVGIRAVCGDFLRVQDLGVYDVVTFNKVLEHVQDPVQLLAKSRTHLNPAGFVYVEVPDGQVACTKGPDREEFFIDHWHVFSDMSLAAMATRSGFLVKGLERLCEPSGKYTLSAFLVPASR